jgi:photosystem II stability/assembly factor-like uncharacterized protein
VYLLACNSTNYSFLGLFLSTNSGTNFLTQSNTPDIVYNQGWYDLSIAVNPTNADDIYVGGAFHWRSINGGVDWVRLPYIHADVHALEFLPGSSTTIFSGNDGGIFKSTDNGTSWADLSNGLAISQIYRLGTSANNPDINLLGLQDNGNIRQINNSCETILFADGMESIIDYTNPDIMYAGSQFGGIYKSTNGGPNIFNIANNNSTGVNAPSAWVTPYIMHPTDHNTLLVGKSQVYRTIDGGSNWSQVGTITLNTGDNLKAIAYAPSSPDYIYAASGAELYVSIDGNSFTFRSINSIVNAGNITYIAVSNTDPKKVWITCSGYTDGGKIFVSTDAGVTWNNYSEGLPNLPADCIVCQNGSNDRLYIGMDVGVYYRDNSMSSWQLYNNGLPNVIVNELEIQYGTGKLRAATYGRGLWECNLLPGCTAPSNTWIGSVSTAWEDAANWSCGVIPDANTDVIIESGTVVLSSNATIRSLTTNSGANITVTSGYNLIVNH